MPWRCPLKILPPIKMAVTQDVRNPALSGPPHSQLLSSTALSRSPTAISVPSSQTSSTVASNHGQSDDDDVNSQFEREAYGIAPGEKGYDEFEVRFAPDEPASPFNWSRVKRWYITILAGILVLNAYVKPFHFSPLCSHLHLSSERSQVQHRRVLSLK
jgi:hypothetical protein